MAEWEQNGRMRAEGREKRAWAAEEYRGRKLMNNLKLGRSGCARV